MQHQNPLIIIPSNQENIIGWPLSVLAALLLHLIVLSFSVGIANNNTQNQPIRVSLINPQKSQNVTPPSNVQKRIEETPTLLPKQIVFPENTAESTPNKPSRLLSNKDLSTEHEQVRHGESTSDTPKPPPYISEKPKEKKELLSEPSPNAPSIKSPTKTKEATNQTTKPQATKQKTIAKPKPAEPNLFLTNREMSMIGKSGAENTEQTSIASKQVIGLNGKSSSAAKDDANARLYSFASRRGSPDFLPDVPEGEMTLLNAKANRYALFVRRVAEKVFGELRAMQWRTIGRGDAMRANQVVTVRAVLSADGTFIKANIEDNSGSSQFDRALLESVKTGAWDHNPPSGIIGEDGNIHFIFQSQLLSRPAPTPSGEARWLILGTGLL